MAAMTVTFVFTQYELLFQTRIFAGSITKHFEISSSKYARTAEIQDRIRI